MQPERNELKIGVVLNYINLGMGNLIPFLYTPIMLRILGQQEYGLFKLSSVATSYLGLISLGLGTAITRYLVKAKTEEGKSAEENMLGLFLFIFRFIAVLSFIIGVILALNLDIWYSEALTNEEMRRMELLVLIMVCNTAFSFSVAPYMSVVTVHERFVFIQCMGILTSIITPLLNLVILFLGYKSVGLAICSLFIAVLSRVIYYYYVKHSLKIEPKYQRISTRLLKEILSFSFWIFVANIVSKLYSATDTMMIGAIPSLAVVGVAIYNIGIILDGMISSMTLGVSGMLSPRINRMVFSGASGEELTDYAILVGRLQCYIVTLLVGGFIVFGKPFLHFYLGDDYLDSYGVTLFISIPKIIVLSQSVCLAIVVAKKQHRFRSLVYLLIAILNVIGTWFVLPFWGVKGAAFMSGISFFLGHGIIMNWYYWRKTGLNIIRFWKQILKTFIIPILLSVVFIPISSFVDLYNFYYLLIAMLLFAVVVFFMQWHFVLNQYEKSLLLTPLRKMKRYNNNI